MAAAAASTVAVEVEGNNLILLWRLPIPCGTQCHLIYFCNNNCQVGFFEGRVTAMAPPLAPGNVAVEVQTRCFCFQLRTSDDRCYRTFCQPNEWKTRRIED